MSKLAVKVYTMREDLGMGFVDIAKKLGGITGQEAARMWLLVKDRRDAFNNREKIVYRKHHINKNRRKVKPATIKKKEVLTKPFNPVMMAAFESAKGANV